KLPRNAVAEKQWEQQYTAYRKEFWRDPTVTDNERVSLWTAELTARLARDYEAVTYEKGKADGPSFRRQVLDLVHWSGKVQWDRSYNRVKALVDSLFTSGDIYGLSDPVKMADFVHPFTQVSDPEIVSLAEGKERMALLCQKPMELSFTATDGRKVD